MKKKIKKKFSSAAVVRFLDLPDYAGGPEEAIEILGRNTLQVEGAKGIHTYEREVVKIRMKGYLLAVHGSNFDLARFEDGCLRIIGRLSQIGWEDIDA